MNKRGKGLLYKALLTGLSAMSIVTPFIYNSENALASTGGKTATQAINWVKSKVGTGIDYDKAFGNQCVDLIKAYYAYLGQSQPFGNASGYTSNSCPNGWKRVKGIQPKKGDVLVYTGGYGGYGHVAIYESDYSHYHQNWNGHSYVEHVTCKYNGNIGVTYWGVIRPDFAAEKSSTSSGTSNNKTISVSGVQLNKSSASLNVGQTVTVSATVTPSNATNKSVSWSSNNPKIATVDKSGKITAVAPGSTYITAKTVDGAKTAKISVTVKYPATGLRYVSGKWIFYKNGKQDNSYTGLTYHNNAWWYVKKGKLDKTFTGLTYHNKAWWYIKNGKLNKSYTGLTYHNKAWWYVKNGKLDKSYNGKVWYNSKTYTVKNGKALV